MFGKILGPKMGSWSVRSEIDPRWNEIGTGEGCVFDGGPQEMKDHIEKCRKLYGDPPSDLTMSFHKY